MEQIPRERRETLRAEFIPSWELVKGSLLQKKFIADDYRAALLFIAECMEPSVKLDHFPDVAFFYNEVLIRIQHHDSGGLVDSSYILAAAIDRIAEDQGLGNSL
jgi:4a-hydroxytetrahydrobiopterin dehydratase